MNELRKHRGIFKVSHELMEERPEALMELFGKCIVVRAESLYEFAAIEYFAYSWLFDEVSEGCKAPRYNIEATETEEGSVLWTATNIGY